MFSNLIENIAVKYKSLLKLFFFIFLNTKGIYFKKYKFLYYLMKYINCFINKNY